MIFSKQRWPGLIQTAFNTLFFIMMALSSDAQIFESSLKLPTNENSQPFGMTIDAEGNIWVSDYGAIRTRKYNATLSQQLLAVVPGYNANLTESPSYTHPRPSKALIDTDGTIYHLEQGWGWIRVYNSAGVQVRSIGGWIDNGVVDDLEFGAPRSMVWNTNGNILVADFGNHRIVELTKAGAFVRKFGTASPESGLGGDGQFRNPSGVTLDKDGNIYVVEYWGHRIQKFKQDGTFLLRISGPGDGDGQLREPNGITIAPNGNLIVTDNGHHRIQEFTPDGQFVQKWGTFGTTDGQFNGPGNVIFTSEGRMLISDTQNGRLQRYTHLSIKSFSPTSGPPGTEITVSGTGFATTQGTNLLKVNGIDLEVVAGSTTFSSIKVKIPTNATTGKISFQREAFSVSSAGEFVVTPISIESYPKVVSSNATFLITGAGFSSTTTSNIVKIGTTTLNVVNASATALRVIAGAGPLSGKLSVSVQGVTATTEDNVSVSRLALSPPTYPEFLNAGDAFAPLVVQVNDYNFLKSISLYYRGISSPESGYKKLELSIPSPRANLMRFDLSAELLSDPIGTKGYLSVIDINDLELTTPVAHTYLAIPAGSFDKPIPNLSFGKSAANYQIIAFPRVFKFGSVSAVMKDLGSYDAKKWRFYGMDKGALLELNQPGAQVEFGKGYWLIVKEQVEIRTGESKTPMVTEENPYEMTLIPGWNIIGNPYNFAISWTDVLAANGSPTGVGTLRLFEGGSYKTADVLNAYRGAFVNNSAPNNVKLKIPVVNKKLSSGRAHQQAPAPIDAPDWTISLSVTDGVITNELGGIGMNRHASIGQDRFDETPLPSPEGVNTFDMSLRKIGASLLIKDIVPTSTEFTWHGTLTSENGVTIQWDNTAFGDNDKQLVMEIEGMASLVDMRLASRIKLNSGSHKFMIHFGDDRYVRKVSLNKEVLVGDASPNPLRRQTAELTIPVSVPAASMVQMTIVDLNGRTRGLPFVWQLDGGRHALTLSLESELAAGLYIIDVRISGMDTSHSYKRKVIIE